MLINESIHEQKRQNDEQKMRKGGERLNHE